MADQPPVEALPLDDNWAYKVSVLADLIARRVSAVVQRHGINLSQWRVLAALADRPGRSASEVVAVTPMDKGIVSRAVAALVDRGLVERRASPTDRRLSHLWLTGDGMLLYQQTLRALHESRAIGDHTIGEEGARLLQTQLDAAIAAYRG